MCHIGPAQRAMKIAWLFSENTDLGPRVDIDQLRDLAPIWGSWRTWRSYGTDNVICYNSTQARQLLEQEYQKVCNLYIHQTVWEELGKPLNTRCFGGEFPHSFEFADDVVAMHLAAAVNDIVLMIGFKLDSAQPNSPYLDFVAQTVQTTKTQWVLIDHNSKLSNSFAGLKNITCDKLQNVLQLLTVQL